MSRSSDFRGFCRVLLGAGLAVGLFAGAAAAQYPKTPPPPGPLTPAPFPPFREVTLPNGLRILVVESHKQPIVSISLSFGAGSVHDPTGKEGLAEMVAGLLTKGAGERTAEQIAETIEGAGGSLTAGAGNDFLTVSASVLTQSLPLAFSLLADVVMRPTFPASEVDLLRTQTLSGLQVALSQPETIASNAFRKALYGEHPYARSATPSTVAAITRDDITAFHRSRLRPGGALLVLAGDVTLSQARRLALQSFQGWLGTPAEAPPARPPAERTATELVLVHRPGSVQSNILVGNLTWSPTDPRHYAAIVANKVLGGGTDSRLFLILREQKSWTYGAYSGLTRRRGIGYFTASAEVRTEVTDSALTELLTQLRRIGNEPIPPAEFEDSKGALTGSYPLSIETADEVANAVANARLYGLPADYVQTYRVRLGEVTPAAAQAAARAAIRPEAAVIVVVGDAQKLYDRVKGIAPTRLVDPEGKSLTPEDLNPKAAALDLDLAALVPRRDSFTVMLQGNPVGWQRGVLERTGDGFTYTEDVSLGGQVRTTTVLTLDGRARLRRIQQSGSQMGQSVSVDVTVADGQAKGTARAPNPQTGQMKEVTIDTAVTEGTVDDNSVQALVPAFRWQPGARWTFSVFSAAQADIKPWTMSVAGTDVVKIGEREIQAYRVELAGAPAPFMLWVSAAAPHDILKMAIAGQPLEWIRAN
jgi:zinc protease